jgi:hypothetical protein
MPDNSDGPVELEHQPPIHHLTIDVFRMSTIHCYHHISFQASFPLLPCYSGFCPCFKMNSSNFSRNFRFLQTKVPLACLHHEFCSNLFRRCLQEEKTKSPCKTMQKLIRFVLVHTPIGNARCDFASWRIYISRRPLEASTLPVFLFADCCGLLPGTMW